MEKHSNIVSEGSGRFAVTCAECGEKAASFGFPQVIRSVIDEGFIGTLKPGYYLYQGITGSQEIPHPHVEAVMKLLEAGSLREVSEYMRELCWFESGMDIFCGKCGLAYCSVHYSRQVIYADDYPCWYDCTEGAEHHRRQWWRKVTRQPSESGSFQTEQCEEEQTTMTN